MTRLPENARSECVAPSVRPFGGVVESMRMFHAACAASQRPAFRPTRGSGAGVLAETIGVTGGGITAGGGGGGAAAGGRSGVVAGADAFVLELAHAGTASAAAASNIAASRPSINHDLIV